MISQHILIKQGLPAPRNGQKTTHSPQITKFPNSSLCGLLAGGCGFVGSNSHAMRSRKTVASVEFPCSSSCSICASAGHPCALYMLP